jgi:hypothetical protein
MTDDLRNRLESARAQEIAKAADQLLNKSEGNLAETIARIDGCSTLLTAMAPRQPQWLWALAVAVCSVLVAGLLWAIPLSRTRILLEAESMAVTARLAGRWDMGADETPPKSPRASIGTLTALHGPLLSRAIESPLGDAWIEVEGESVWFSKLSLQSNGELVIEAGSPDQLTHVYARGARLDGTLAVVGAVKISAGATEDRIDSTFKDVLTVPESIQFRSSGSGAVSTRLALHPESSWLLHDLPVTHLSFSWDVPAQPGRSSIRTALLSGMLTLYDSSRTVKLAEGEHVVLNALTGRIIEMRIDRQVRVIFEGTAGDIVIGPQGFQQRLTPTYLEYVYHHQPLAFFWSATAFLGGILWSAKRLLLG